MTQPAFPSLPPPPSPAPVPVDPEILILIGVTGAILGAVASVAGYLASEWAGARGREQRGLSDILPFFRQQ